jgi:ABC-2 type transport system ATP-binding protein
MILRFESVTKTYGRHRALDDISLNVREGDCYGFLGHNGAGKTTALRIALGLIPCDRGRVVVDGFDARRHPREARVRQGGLIERPGFYPWMSGRRNLFQLGRLHGFDRKRARGESERLLEVVGLSSAGDRAAGGYSQGMRQRLGIAQALLGDPTLVLLDEPMNGLDPEGIEEFRRLLVRLTREEGKTVVFSSHQLHEIAGICNRIGILRQGRMLVEAETEELIAAEGRRFLLKTGDDNKAGKMLDGLGLAFEEAPRGGLVFDVGERKPGRIAAEVVARGMELRELSPEEATLEEIYLRYSRADEGDAVTPATTAEPDARPAVIRAPRFALPRVFRAEVSRLTSHFQPILAMLLPALLAALAVFLRYQESAGYAKEVEAGELFSVTVVTAFEGATMALRSALPLAALILAGLASQSLAGELSRGTLRNLLLCPLDRTRLALGKIFGLLAAGLATYGVLVLVANLMAGGFFDYADVVEETGLKGADPYVLTKAEDLWTPFLKMFPMLALPLLAYAGLGFLAGALARRGVTALALAAGGFVFLDLFRVVGRSFGFEEYLLSAYLPSPLGDTSYTSHVIDLIQAPNDPPGGYVESALTVPGVWLIVTVALATLVLSRRSVP